MSRPDRPDPWDRSPTLAILSTSWRDARCEAGAAARSLAGALSRHGSVDVLVTGPPDRREADGAFDRVGIGEAPSGSAWPERDGTADLGGAGYDAVLVDAGDASALGLAGASLPSAKVLLAGGGPEDAATATVLDVGFRGGHMVGVDGQEGRADDRVLPVGLYVRVHPYAAERPHHELGGATGYVLVLSGRGPGQATVSRPTGQVRWLLARFARRQVVVVENAVAAVFRARSLTSTFAVHTRMDLWRLIAHAWATVDLSPGPLFARECVESLRYGVPVVVPRGTPADRLVEAGGGIAFDDTESLLEAVGALGARPERERTGTNGRAAVDRWYGDPAAFVSRVGVALHAVTRG